MKIINDLKILSILAEKVPPQITDRVLNTPLVMSNLLTKMVP